MFEPEYEKGLVFRGNLFRLKQAMKKAEAGDPVTVCFLGGSITQGSLSSRPETCYACRTYLWWRETFPQAEIRYLNAGIGGTTSQFGVARAEEDVLRYSPDVITVEFSVNDENTPFFRETYEGLIRRLWRADCRPALLLLHNVCYDTGASAETIHREVGAHYALPSVSIRPTTYGAILGGKLSRGQITPDDLHPNDEGHRLLSGHLTAFLSRVYLERNAPEEPICALPAPLTENRFEDSVRFHNGNVDPVLNGFTPDPEPQTHVTQFFRRGYTASRAGDSAVFRVCGTVIAVQYRKTVNRPTPVARVIIDGNEAAAQRLDGNFEENWGDCLYLQTVAERLLPGMHTVRIEITETHPEDRVPFYLVSVIASGQKESAGCNS